MAGVSMFDAVTQVHQEAQARQAAQAPPPEDGQATAPEQQPGLANPGAGAEQAPAAPTVAAPNDSVGNLSMMLRDLSTPRKELGQENVATAKAG